MFAYIKGTVTEIGTDEIIVETGGIGFSVFTSSQDSARLTKNQQATIYTHLNVLSILSCLSVDELRMAVLSDDYKAIAKANGIGPKTAQRLVIELRDKFHLEDVLGEYDEASPATSAPEDIVSETAMALSSLGYSNVEALRAIKKVPDSESMTVEQLLKAALKHII